MQKKSNAGSELWIDPDDAPELTADMLDDAEVFDGSTFVRRGRGRPTTGNAKELVAFRLDRDVIAKLREAGPGWQSRVSELLRGALKSEIAPVASVAEVADQTSPMVNLHSEP